jgi:hypothetical protein
MANPVPRANGIRLVARSVAEPTANQMVPKRAARSPKWLRASSVKHTVARTAPRAPASCGPKSHPSGGARIEYAGVWWPPYHWPFQIVKPSRPNRSERKMCAARSGERGLTIR